MSFVNKTDKFETIQPGSLILKCKPFAFALNKESVQHSCDHCFRSTKDDVDAEELRRCAGCHLVLYCDRSCQKQGWLEGHRWECKGFKTFGKVAPTYARLLLRIICRLKTESDYYDIVPPKTHRRFKDLVSHFSDVKKDQVRMEQVATIEKVVESILSHHPSITVPNESEMIALCGRIFVNTFCILNQEFREMGSGLYIGASIFDHSCEPMAVATFTSTTVEIRNIVALPSNFPVDKITICYQDALRASSVRIAELRKSYYFDCACERCSTQKFDSQMLSVYCADPLKAEKENSCEVNPKHYDRCPTCGYEISPDYARKVSEVEAMVLQKIQDMTQVTYLDVCESCINVMNSLHFSDTHWMKCHMAYAAFEACIEKQEWERALKFGQLALKGQRKYLRGSNPNLGISLLKMAKLTWFLEKDKLAKSYLDDARRILAVTHGENSEIVQSHVQHLYAEMASMQLQSMSLQILRMTWTVRKMAQYVAQSKYLQQLKENDEICLQAFEKAKFLFFCKGKPLLTDIPKFSIAWTPFEEAETVCKDLKETSVLLTVQEDTEDKPLFACPVSPEVQGLEERLNGNFADMRKAILLLGSRDAALVSRGYSLLKWHDTFKYCPTCASPLNRNVSGTFRTCSKPCNPSNIHHYPHTSPVAITRVVDQANERTVLVRQPRHPKGMYSCIAGFIEPGENLESTVRREIAEEVGLVVGEINYFRSQTWALPQDSLMLGCCAVAMPGSEEFDIDKGELQDAKWFTKAEVLAAYNRIKENPGLLVKNENDELIIPPRGAIAHDLLKDWIKS